MNLKLKKCNWKMFENRIENKIKKENWKWKAKDK